MGLRKIERQFERFRRRGDPQSLANVFDATAPEVLRVASHLSRDLAAAEDLLQRTFVTAIEAAPSWDASRPLVPWLLGILANHARDAARKEARAVDPERLPRREIGDPAVAAGRKEESEAILRAIDGLDDPVRGILYLHFRHGLKPAEIALALGMPPATVRSHIHRGVESLRRTVPSALLAGLSLPESLVRGTAAVRSAVVACASQAGPRIAAPVAATAGPAVLGGVLVGKKAMAVAAALLLTGGAAFLHWERGFLGSTSESFPPAPAALGAREVPTLASRPRGARETPRPAEGPSGPTASRPDPTKGALEIRLLARNGAPLADEPLVLAREGTTLDYHSHRTGPEGRARVDDLEPGTWAVGTARRAGATADVAAGAVTAVEIRVQRGLDLEGVVVDLAGEPVAAAEVWIDRNQTRSQGMIPVARTDAQGRFRVEDVDPYGTVSARAAGHTPSGVRRLRLGEGQTETVRLVLGGPGENVEGRVGDEEGRPVVGAFVLVGVPYGLPRDLPDGTQGYESLPTIVYTDGDGAFALEGVPVGQALVTVRARGYGGLRTMKDVSAAPPATRWTLVLRKGMTVAGVVVDEAGAPVSGARVATEETRDVSWAWSAITDADGRFRLEDWPLENAPSLRAAHATRGNAVVPLRGPSGWDPAALRVVLRPRLGILVRVVDEAGAPIAGCRVAARTPQYPTGQAWATTDPEGRAFLDVGENGVYEVFVIDPAGESWQPCARTRDVRPGANEVALVLREADRPTARIVGRMLGPDGKPLEGVFGSAMPRTGSAGMSLQVDPTTGLLTSKLLQPGDYEVSLDAPGFGRVPLGRARLSKGHVTDLGEIRLERPGSLVVRVHGAEDLIQSGGSIRIESERGTVWARPERDGVARVPCLQPGRYYVVVDGFPWGKTPTGAATAVVVVESGKEVATEVTVARGHVRRFRVDGLSRDEMEGLSIRVHAEGQDATLLVLRFSEAPPLGVAPINEGAFSPGRYAAEATTADDRRATATFDVSGEGEPPVVLAGFR